MIEAIEYMACGKITAKEYIEFFRARRPQFVLDPCRVDEMLSRSILVTARRNGQLVGFIRILSDGYVFSTIAEIMSMPEFYDDGEWVKKMMSLAAEVSQTRLVLGTHRVNPDILRELGWNETFMGYAYKNKPRVASK